MSNFTFKPAVREQIPVLIGLVGPSGGGKTMSALELATGIQSVTGGEIAVIDSEARRALHYADDYKFQHLDFQPPFASVRYLQALQAAAEMGAKVAIVDSTSHEHEGEGGYLDLHEKELDRMTRGDASKRESANWRAWAKPAAERRKFINGLLQMHIHVIFCFRAKERLIQAKNDRTGKNELIQTGWQAIAGEEFVFEMTHRFLLPPGSQGVPDFSEEAWRWGVPKLPKEHREMFSRPLQLNRDIGAQFAQWAQGGDPRGPLIRRLEAAARQRGGKAFKAEWDKLNQEDKAIVGREERDRIIQVAKETDAALQSVTKPTKETLLSRVETAPNDDVLDMIAEDANELADDDKAEVAAAIAEARKAF